MVFKSDDCQLFQAGDHTMLKELLHPKNTGINMPFSIALGYLDKGQSSVLHTLEQSETYFIIEGNAFISIEGKEFYATTNDCVFVPSGSMQFVKNIGPSKLQFLCIVSPPWTESGEQIKD